MSDLNATEIFSIQKMIERKTKDKGFIWDFSNATFSEFVKSYTGIDIYQDKYVAIDGTSKMKRLKTFLSIEENYIVEDLLNGIIEYGSNRNYLNKTNIKTLNKYINKLKKAEKEIKIDSSIFKSQKKVELLIKDINNNVNESNYELAIDRLHTLFKLYIEVVCSKMDINIENKSLDSLYGELTRKIYENKLIKEGVTNDILSSSKKIMKSFDYARNNSSYAHTNNIMKKSEAEFLCKYIIDLFEFLNKIKLENCLTKAKK